MDFIGVAIGILVAILVVSGIIFLIGYVFKNAGVKINFDISLDGYFYFVRLISGGVFCLAGLARILQAVFAMLFGDSFSFEMITIYPDVLPNESGNDSLESKPIQMLDGSVQASLFTGITTAIISGIIYLVHVFLQRKNLSSITKDFAKNNVSIKNLIQKPDKKNKRASIIIITHENYEKNYPRFTPGKYFLSPLIIL